MAELNESPHKDLHAGLQLLRPLVCLLVIYNHVPIEGISRFPTAIQKGWMLLISTAVPCFVIMSFFLTAPVYLADHFIEPQKLKNRLLRLIRPFIAWSLLGFVIYPKEISPINILLQMIFGSVVNAPLYYMSILIYLTLIFSLLTLLKTKIRLVILCTLAVACLCSQYKEYSYSLINPLSESCKYTLGRFFELLPYAVIGIFIRKFYDIRKNEQQDYRPSLILLISAPALLVIGSVVWALQTLPGFGYHGLGLVLCSISVFMIFLIQSNRMMLRITPRFIISISSVSLGIYCSHYLIDRIIRSWFGHSFVYNFLVSIPFIYGILLFICSALLCLKLKKLANGRYTRYVS